MILLANNGILMKKTLALTITLAFLLSLVFPNQSAVFASKADGASNANSTINTSQTSLIKVVVAAAPQAIVVSSNIQATAPAACQSAAIGGNNLLQGVSQINLNIPANCFSLQIARQARPLRQLVVLPLARQNLSQIVVLNNPSEILMPNVTPAPVSQNLPALPLVAAAAIAGFAVLERFVRQKIARGIQHVKFSLTLEQLQIMRC